MNDSQNTHRDAVELRNRNGSTSDLAQAESCPPNAVGVLLRTPGKLCAAILAAVALPVAATANIWDNGTPDQSTAWNSDINLNTTVEADDFSFSSQQDVTDFVWWGAYDDDSAGDPIPNPAPADDFEVAILDDNSGSPGPNVLNSFTSADGTFSRTKTGNSLTIFSGALREEYKYEFSLNAPAMIVSGDYWLVIRNNTNASAQDQDFFWSWSTSTNNIVGTNAAGTSNDRAKSDANLGGGGWGGPFGDQLAFQIVPEPQHYGAMGGLLALVTAVLLRRRR